MPLDPAATAYSSSRICKLGDLMREVYPGTWRGSIDFTLQPGWCCTNSVDCPIRENDGSGRGIQTRNRAHKTVCTTEERLRYYPQYGEQIFDLTLGKRCCALTPKSENEWISTAARSDVSDPVSPQSKRRPPREGAFFGRRHRLPIRSQ